MTEQEAFEKRMSAPDMGYDMRKTGDSRYYANADTLSAWFGWQAHGRYEAERVKKLVEALEAITRVIADSPVKVYQEMERVAHRALREYQGGKDANA